MTIPTPKLNKSLYDQWYQESIESPETFWEKQAQTFLSFKSKWSKLLSYDFKKGNIEWFKGSKLNVCYNCVDRHAKENGSQTAIIYESDSAQDSYNLSYQQLLERVCQFANLLKSMGVSKSDRVCIYMPMIPEAAIAMLACARIGAVHSVVFGGFSPEALAKRIEDARCEFIVTANEGLRGGKRIPLKANVDAALELTNLVKKVAVLSVTESIVTLKARDVDASALLPSLATECEIEWVDAEDPLFILYTSGSTGQPKGVLHSSAGYLLYATMTFRYVFDYQDGDVYWCTADVGWVTGHSYIVYGPLCLGAKTLIFAGTPTYPKADRFWEVIDKHQVNIFYTAPTAIRALMAYPDTMVKNHSLASLKLLGTVGEPINPEAWRWYKNTIGGGRLEIIDTWWQTETGGVMIAPLPGIGPQKPGCAARPFFGVKPHLLDEKGHEIKGKGEGYLAFSASWPGQMRTVYNNHQRFVDSYLSQYSGYYFSGDGARRDSDGDIWITGRVDDVINVSGHRLGTAEIESALVTHPKVVEAAVVGILHPIKGEALWAYVSLDKQSEPTEALSEELQGLIAKTIGKFARAEKIQWANELPKTRSGKIMRRILRKIACGEYTELGDTSTLAEPACILQMIKDHKELAQASG